MARSEAPGGPGGTWKPALEDLPEQCPPPGHVFFALAALTSGVPNFGFE